MIEPKQIIKCARTLYGHIKERSAPTYWKSGRMKGRMKWPGVEVPYTSDEFATWLLTTVGCQAFLCPYCNAPLDVLSMTMDHDRPLKGGGTNEFGNLVPCCADCNTLKGKMNSANYLKFRLLLRELDPFAEADVLQRLRSGAMGMRLSQQMRAEQARKNGPALVAVEDDF